MLISKVGWDGGRQVEFLWPFTQCVNEFSLSQMIFCLLLSGYKMAKHFLKLSLSALFLYLHYAGFRQNIQNISRQLAL